MKCTGKNPYQENWWDKKTFLGISRNGLVWIGVLIVFAALYYFLIDWDMVFGLRPHR